MRRKSPQGSREDNRYYRKSRKSEDHRDDRGASCKLEYAH